MAQEMIKIKQEEAAPVAVTNVPWAIWLSSGVVIVLLLFSTIMLMVTPANSLAQYRPLIRPREGQQPAIAEAVSDGAESTTTTDEELKKRIEEIYNRKGFSNPDPDPEDNPVEASSELGTRIDNPPPPKRRRTRRPIGKDFDPSQSYVRKHENGTIVYVFPKNITPISPAKLADDSTKAPNPNSNEVTYRTSSSISRDIVFPSDLEMQQEESTCTFENPSCTRKRSVAENEEIDRIMANHKDVFAGVFGNDVVVTDGDGLQTRFDTSDDVPLCTPRERLIHPQYGFTRDKRNLTIVNTDTLVQGVRVEYCENAGKSCNELDRIFPTECKQMYHFRTLLAIHPETKKPYKEQFKLPSCCKCVKKNKPLLFNPTKRGW